MRKPTVACVTGPLSPYASGYRLELAGLGYSPWTASAHMYLMAHVSRWLQDQGVQPAGLDSAAVREFLAHRRASGQVRRLTPRGLIPLLAYLRGLGVVPDPTGPAQDGPLDWLVEEFAGYLVSERGLSSRTLVGYRRVAARFLAECSSGRPVPECGLAGLDGEGVKDFILGEGARLSVGSANNVVTALRSLMHFLYLLGYTPTSLADAVPRCGMAGYRPVPGVAGRRGEAPAGQL